MSLPGHATGYPAGQPPVAPLLEDPDVVPVPPPEPLPEDAASHPSWIVEAPQAATRAALRVVSHVGPPEAGWHQKGQLGFRQMLYVAQYGVPAAQPPPLAAAPELELELVPPDPEVWEGLVQSTSMKSPAAARSQERGLRMHAHRYR